VSLQAIIIRRDDCGHPSEIECPACEIRKQIPFSDRHGYGDRGQIAGFACAGCGRELTFTQVRCRYEVAK
jgi:hypothetical protein